MKPACVLVVDDKENVLNLMRDVLEPRFSVELASDARRALAQALDGQVDVVVADIRMPELDGFTLLAELKRTRPEVEVVLMTAYGGVESAVQAIRSGAFDYLTKPCEPDQILEKVERAAGRRRALQQSRLAELSYKDAMALAHDRACLEYLQSLMLEFRGNVSLAAERAKIERESLHRLLKRYGVQSRDFRRLN